MLCDSADGCGGFCSDTATCVPQDGGQGVACQPGDCCVSTFAASPLLPVGHVSLMRWNPPAGGPIEFYIPDPINHRVLKASPYAFTGQPKISVQCDAGSIAPIDMVQEYAGNFTYNVVAVDHAGNQLVKFPLNTCASNFGAVPLSGSGAAGCGDSSNGSTVPAVKYNGPTGLMGGGTVGLYRITDTGNRRLVAIDPGNSSTTYTGACGSDGGVQNGTLATGRFSNPGYLANDYYTGIIFIADGDAGVRTISFGGTSVGTLPNSNFGPVGVINYNPYMYFTGDHRVIRYAAQDAGMITLSGGSGEQGILNGTCASARFRDVSGMWIDLQLPLTMYVYDSSGSNAVIRKITNLPP